MNRVVMIRITEGFNPFEVLNDVRSIGFQFDHLLPYDTKGLLLVGEMSPDNILKLKLFDGVDSFRTAPGIRRI